jgi:hypothetical protein
MANAKKTVGVEESSNLAGMALPDFVLKAAATSLSKSLIEDNRGPTQREITTLRKRLANAFQAVSLHLAEFPKEQAEAIKYLETANRNLSSKESTSQNDIMKTEENLIRALVILDRKIKSTQSIKKMVLIVIASSTVYFTIIGVLQYLVFLDGNFNLLGTPGLILSWGCLGGVTATLFRHRSMMERKWPFDLRWLWIAVRPLLGMIMGAFIFQAIVSGLIIFGSSPMQSAPREQLLWALAFVGGFSDRVWEFLINSVLGPYSQESKSSNEKDIDS